MECAGLALSEGLMGSRWSEMDVLCLPLQQVKGSVVGRRLRREKVFHAVAAGEVGPKNLARFHPPASGEGQSRGAHRLGLVGNLDEDFAVGEVEVDGGVLQKALLVAMGKVDS